MPADIRVLVLADDLIWADRLARAVIAAGATPIRVATVERFTAEIEAGDGAAEAAAAGDAADDPGHEPAVAIVDLAGRGYDGLAAIEAAAAAGWRILAVGQHDDHDLRKRALAAGAERVLAYQKLFGDGPATIERFLATPARA